MDDRDLALLGRAYFFYRRILCSPAGADVCAIFQVDLAHHFFLQHAVAKWETMAGNPAPGPNFQFLIGGQGIPFSPDFLPGGLFESPGDLGVSWHFDGGPFTGNFDATPLKLAAELEYPFQFREIIEVKVSGFTKVAPIHPRAIDLLLVGQYYPTRRGEGMGPSS